MPSNIAKGDNMRTETKEIDIYEFSDLSDHAKDNARERLSNYEWHDPTIENLVTELEEKGFLYSKISFSGFWSQGDGASFTSECVDLSKILEKQTGYSDKERKTLAACIDNGFIQCAIVRNDSRYSHKNTCSTNFEHLFPGDIKVGSALDGLLDIFERDIEDCRLNLCQCIYSSLENEYNHLQTDEYLNELCDINGYEFTAEGELY